MKENNRNEVVKLFGGTGGFDFITNNSDDFDVKTESTIRASLAAQGSAILAGNFTAHHAGEKKLRVELKYKESGEVVQVFASTLVEAVQLGLEMVAGIPNTVALNSKHEVEFLISNNGKLDATKINIEPGQLDITEIIEEKYDESSKTWKQNSSFALVNFEQRQLADKKLDGSCRFRIKGNVTIKVAGNFNLGTLITYDEAKHLPDLAKKEGVKVVGSKDGQPIVVKTISVKGETTMSLPNRIKLGQTYPVRFTFTNNDADFNITNITIEIKDEIKGGIDSGNDIDSV